MFCEVGENLVINIEELKVSYNGWMLLFFDCYEVYIEMGIYYGDSYRVIDSLYVGENGVLVKLMMFFVIFDIEDYYILYLSMIDLVF